VTPLAKQIKHNKSLSQIYMSHNNLTDHSIGLLAEAIKENSTLTELFITHNDLSLPNGVNFIQGL